MKVLHNPTDAPVRDYPIQDPNSKEVLLWNILPGETLEFPDHVGTYLLEVYGFLQEVMTQDQVDQREKEKEKVQTGKVFSQVKIVKAEGEVVEPVKEKAAGFTNETLQPHNAPVVDPKASIICPDCKVEFGKQTIMEKHRVEKHTQPA